MLLDCPLQRVVICRCIEMIQVRSYDAAMLARKGARKLSMAVQVLCDMTCWHPDRCLNHYVYTFKV